MIRSLKILLAGIVAYWGLIGVMGNLLSLDITYEYVEMVTSFTGIAPKEGAEFPPWQTSNPIIVSLGVLLIVSGKLGAFIFCSLGVYKMIKAHKASAEVFAQAKQFAVFGCGLAIVMLFGGFIVIGETMYLMWANPDGASSAQAAWRYGGFMALIMIFIGQKEPYND